MADYFLPKIKKGYRKASVFWPVLIIVFTIVFIGIVFVWNSLWNYLKAYEAHNPIHTVEKYVDFYKNGDISKILKSQGIKFDKFNDENQYYTYIKNTYGDNFKDIKALKTKSEGKKLNYNVYLNDKKIAQLSLSPNGKTDDYNMEGWNISSSSLYKKQYSAKIYIPEGNTPYLNNIKVTDEYKLDESYGIDDYNSLDDKSLLPKFVVYEVKELLNKPVVSVKDKNEKELKVTEKDGAYYALPQIDESLKKELEQLTEKIGSDYAKFSTSQIKFEDISPYLVKESSYYKRVKSFVNEWTKERKFSYDNVKFGQIIMYDDTHVVTDISFTYHINLGYKVNNYDVHYKMSLIKINGKWLVAEMKL